MRRFLVKSAYETRLVLPSQFLCKWDEKPTNHIISLSLSLSLLGLGSCLGEDSYLKSAYESWLVLHS